MKRKPLLTFCSLIAITAMASSSLSFAHGGGHHHGHPPHHHHPGNGDAAAGGFLAGLLAALLTSQTIVTANDPQYNDETLKVEAAAYQDSGVEGPVLQAIINQVAQELGQSPEQIDRDALTDLILDQ